MKLVVLDRDGVINFDSVHFIKSTNEWIPIPGSLEAIALLNQSGYRVAMVMAGRKARWHIAQPYGEQVFYAC